MITRPAEDDGLGTFRGMFNALPLLIVVWAVLVSAAVKVVRMV